MEYQVFTTGDQLWTSQRGGMRVTVKLLTHDGWYWEEGEETRRLTGVEKILHRIEVFCMKTILKVTAS